jgi:DNA-binding protein H-NS
MARANFGKMSVRELKAAKAEIEDLIERKSVEERAAVKAEIARLASARGYSVAELFNGTNGRAGRRGKVAPKYRNPENGLETWTGRGRQPRWLAALVKKGAKVEKFLIK